LDQKLSFGFDLFYNNASYYSSVYDIRRYGAAVRLGKALSEFWRLGFRYQYEMIDIYDVDDDASSRIRNEEGERSKSSVVATLTYDSRDDLYLTRKGERLRFEAEGAGGPLMGDTDIWRLEIDAVKYWLMPYDLIFSLQGHTEVVNSYGDSDRVPLFDRMFLGGSRTVRGFSLREIGPTDEKDEPIGGNTMAYFNSEVTYPIMDRVRGAVFADGGFNNEDAFNYSVDGFSMGAGFGVRLNLPIGLLKLDLGFPLVVPEENRESELGDFEFHFDVGYEF
jgi:outer membrane protein insertion porin family